LDYPTPQNSKIIVYGDEIRVSKEDIINLKDILDKLKIHYIIDDISFHATDAIVGLMKYFKNTNVWKVEKNGSVNLKNRFGHSDHLEYRTLCIPSLIEFLFADMNVLNDREAFFLDVLIKKASNISLVEGLS
jgi:hypothetical protein